MWLVIRVVLAVIGFAIRQLGRMPLPGRSGMFQRIPYFKELHNNGFTIGMRRRSSAWVSMRPESYFDQLCKRLGIANELQTGDPRFDDRVYVICDHPHIHTILRESRRLRSAVLAAFDAGFRWIRFDGAAVRMRRNGTREPSKRDLALLQAVWATSGAFKQKSPSRLADPFLWKALVIEGVIWSLAGYAIGAGMELFLATASHHMWTYVWYGEVVVLGIVVALATLVVLLAISVLWLRGSSRGHRLILESAVVLALGLPPAAIQLVGDSNRILDDAPAVVVHTTLLRCEVRASLSKGRTISSYHLHLARPTSVEPRPPAELEVSEELCAAAGTRVDFEMGPGRWGIPWYREIRVGDLVVETPMTECTTCVLKRPAPR